MTMTAEPNSVPIKKKIGRAAPLKNTKDAVALGLEAWARLKKGTSWEDWKLIGKALLVGKEEVLKKTSGKKGRRYIEEFSHWIEEHGFGEIDKADRTKLISIMENLEEIEEWRASLTEWQRAQ